MNYINTSVNPQRPRQRPASAFNAQPLHDEFVAYLERVAQNPQETRLFQHQVDAVLNLIRYFNAYGDVELNPNRNDIALVVLPTGCGKTGVAVLASYALNASRVLVITPSVVISKQIYGAYENFLVDYKVFIPDEANLPSQQLIQKSTQMRDDSRCSLVVTNAHKVGGGSRVKIGDIPNDRYDLVIVDEAHHYPATTWKDLVDHFPTSQKLFLTATPEHNGQWILPGIRPCYELKRDLAVERGIIRPVSFEEVHANELVKEEVWAAIAYRMEALLDQHDRQVPTVKHQGMVLTQTKKGINPAEDFTRVYNSLFRNQCAVYVSETSKYVLENFKEGNFRVLVIIGRLLEGFDRKEVSVLGIVRNVAPASRVLFAQFVGRAVRKTSPRDPVSAVIVTHSSYNQRANYEKFDTLAEVDPEEED